MTGGLRQQQVTHSSAAVGRRDRFRRINRMCWGLGGEAFSWFGICRKYRFKLRFDFVWTLINVHRNLIYLSFVVSVK